MNRTDLQILADDRVADAEALLLLGRWAGAYYCLLGYAVECAFKACIAKQFREFEVPEKTLVNNFYTHRLEILVITSHTEDILNNKLVDDTHFDRNWETVRLWNEASRYDHSTDEESAPKMHKAVCDSNSGVLQWLKTMLKTMW